MTDFGHGHVEREILSALVDGELDADRRRYVHEHLQACADCRAIVDEFGHVHGLLTGLPSLVAPEAFVAAALQPPSPSRVRAMAGTALRGRRRWIAATLAGAAASITIGGLAMPAPSSEPPVDSFIEQHVTLHAGVESGGQVLFAVHNR